MKSVWALLFLALTSLTLANAAPTAKVNETAADCSNIKDWTFFNAQVTDNNLGGVGPNNTSGAQEIRYSNVADEIDLVLSIDTTHQAKPYVTNPTCKDAAGNKCVIGKDAGCPKPGMTCGDDNNGFSGKFGQVNVKGGTSVAMKFTLVDAGTENPVDIAPGQTVFFSVFDFDSSIVGAHEYVDFTTPLDSHRTTPTTTVKLTGDDKHLYAQSGRQGDDSDNPTDPLNMTQLQLDSAVWVTYTGRNTWGMTFGESGNPKGKGGRNLMFAGRAEGDCPPGPAPFPKGACDTGLEGMIKGGGRVCCPVECGQTGKWEKWAGAPNACAGPGCDKGPDGVRNDNRYQDCCLGKPIIFGNDKAKIDVAYDKNRNPPEPYGIVHKRRFCTSLTPDPGTDGPPCINKLSRDPNPNSYDELQ